MPKSKNYSRREFVATSAAAMATSMLPLLSACRSSKQKPNILWITSEDNCPFLGCYGDEFATTPRLDQFAKEGILFLNAYATAPVCAPSRCTIISGVYPPSLGTEHMRSTYPVPELIRFYPQYLREIGYYCTNNVKKDYNMPEPEGVWDESSNKATYKNRQPEQPFFAIFNITTSHESSIHQWEDNLQHDPAKVKLPDYHPDTPEMRHDWAQYYDKVSQMDTQVGQFLDELEQEGLVEDTIVFYYADNGGVLGRSKRFCYESGLHIPMIVRFPKKFRHLAPAKPGTRTDQLVNFADLAPTLLNLAGIPIPAQMQGLAFLGKNLPRPNDYAFSFRGRMDERYDMVRTARDKRFRYIRNFNPHRIYAQHVEYLWKAPSMQSWEKAYREGRCNAVQSIFWGPKPAEELYDLQNDPYEVKNLASDPQFQDTLERMRNATQQWMLDIRDAGFIPEGMMLDISQNTTLYEFVRSERYPLERILETADLATDRNESHLDELIARLADPNPVVRYWAATGCLILGEWAKIAASDLEKLLSDEPGDVQVVAAEALCHMGQSTLGLNALARLLSHENSKVVLRAANALDCLGDMAKAALPELKKALLNEDDYVKRAVNYTLSKLTA